MGGDLSRSDLPRPVCVALVTIESQSVESQRVTFLCPTVFGPNRN